MSKEIKTFQEEYRFLSNFYPSPIAYQEDIYPTAEHLYQALKTKNELTRKHIRIARTPGQAKKMGRTIPSIYFRRDWEEIKYELMFMVVRLKFSQNSKLKQALFRTEGRTLTEGNRWHDNIWGNCLCPKCIQITGENHLGKILMRVRRMF